MKKTVCLLVLLMLSLSAFSSNDFEIKDGVLVKYNGNAKIIEIPENVTYIGKEAFAKNKKIEKVTIPGTVNTIEDKAFMDCPNLKEVIIESGVRYINYRAFCNDKKIEKITVPGTVKTIGDSAFANCSNLEEINIENGVSVIGATAFYAYEEPNYKLKKLRIPSSVYKIGRYAFNSCYNIEELIIEDGVKIIDSAAFGNYCRKKTIKTKLKSLVIPGSVKVIEEFAFYNIPSIENLVIQEGVEKINKYAFMCCRHNPNNVLKEINIPRSVTGIEEQAFAFYKLKPEIKMYKNTKCDFYAFVSDEKEVSDGDRAEYYANNILYYGLDNEKELQNAMYRDLYLNRITNIKKIDEFFDIKSDVFVKYTGKDEIIKIPDGVTKIGENAFKDCNSIKEIYIPDSVISINNSAFANCSNLETIHFGNKLQTIGKGAFKNCKKLKFLEIPDSVITVEEEAFCNCANLEEIIIGSKVEKIGKWAFGNSDNKNSKLVNIKFPKTLKQIDEYAFYGYTNLKNVNLWDSIKYYKYSFDSNVDIDIIYSLE